MLRVREHIDRLDALDAVAVAGEIAEVALAGRHTVCGHEHDEDLPAAPAAPHEHVPQRAAAGVLIIGADLEALEQTADRDDDLIGDGVLDQAVADRDDAV